VKSYSVSWEIELDAETPQDAARLARRYMLATGTDSFTVCDDQGNVTSVELEREKEG
jgi:hypothetical protein